MDHLWTSVLNIVPLSHLFGVFCMFVFVLLYNRYLNSFFFFEKPEKPQQIPWRSSWISLRQMVLSFAIPFTAMTFSRGPPVTTRSLKVGESMKSISFEKRFWQICDVFLCLLTSVDWVLCIFSTIYPKRHQHRVLHLTPVLSIRNALLEDCKGQLNGETTIWVWGYSVLMEWYEHYQACVGREIQQWFNYH